jgi:hypothetical protein
VSGHVALRSCTCAGLLALGGCGSVWGDPIVGGTASGSGSAEGTADGGSSDGSQPTDSWCDPATWPDGVVPTASTDVVVPTGDRIVVDCDAEAHTIEVQDGGELFAARDVATTLTVHGNFVVYGRVDWGTPEDRILDVTAEIVFADVRDDAFVGTPPAIVGDASGPTQLTPIEVVASDTGLWVLGEGELFAAGRVARSWGVLLDDVGPGDPVLELDDATGWRAGDRIVLTPTSSTAVPEFDAEIEEALVAAVDGNTVTLAAAPSFVHFGCAACQRRGEAARLDRNVVIRSADHADHAHILVAESGRLGLDGVELRWLGPAWPAPRCDAPWRRAPIRFHQQHDASRGSFVRHTSIWGGKHGSIAVERSHGIEIADVVAYASDGTAFTLEIDTAACGNRCDDENEQAPRDVVYDRALAIGIGVVPRAEDCAPISHRISAFELGGGDGSGCRGCVAAGIAAGPSQGSDASAFHWPERGGSPTVFADCVAHDSDTHGIFSWHEAAMLQGPFAGISLWSLSKSGIAFSGRSTGARFSDVTIADTLAPSVSIASQGPSDAVPLFAVLLDSVELRGPLAPHGAPFAVVGARFSGAVSPAVTNAPADCIDGDPDDPNDQACTRAWLRLTDPEFAAGTVPFAFGMPANRHTVWEIRGFAHPDHPELPADFDLFRADATVDGGVPAPEFDAILVPR